MEAASILQILTEEESLSINALMAARASETDPIKRSRLFAEARAINAFMAKVIQRIKTEKADSPHILTH